MCIPWVGGYVFLRTSCLGYRSMIALLVVAIVYAVALRVPFARWPRVVMLAIATAIVGNILRIASVFGIALLHWGFAFGLWHDISGYIVFMAELAIVARYCERRKGDV